MRSVMHLGLTAALTFSVAAFAQTPSGTPATPAPTTPSNTPSSTQTTPASTTPADTQATPASTTPADTHASPAAQAPDQTSAQTTPSTTQPPADVPAEKPTPGNPTLTKKQIKDAAKQAQAQNQNKSDDLPSPGEALDPHIKPGSEDDVNAVGTRNIGGRGAGNWFSTDWEIRNGKSYSMEIEKSAHLVTDPVIVEYVNRVGQNIVKNSDC
jgi:hypothetical protein